MINTRTFLRICLKAGLGLVLIWGMVLTGIWAGLNFLETQRGRDWLFARLGTKIPGQIQCRGLALNLIQGEMAVDDIVIQGPDHAQVARADRLALAVHWAALLKGEVRVRSLALSRPAADLVMGKDGRLNLMAALTAPSDQGEGNSGASLGVDQIPLNLIIDRAVVSQGRFSYKGLSCAKENRAPGPAGSVAGLDFSLLGFNLKKMTGEVMLSFDRGMAEVPESCLGTDSGQGQPSETGTVRIPLLPGRIMARLDHGRTGRAGLDGVRLAGLKIQAQTEDLELTLYGSVSDLLGDPDLDLTLESWFAARGGKGLAGQLLPGIRSRLPQGRVHVQAHARGGPADPQIRVTLDSDRLALAWAEFETPLNARLSLEGAWGRPEADSRENRPARLELTRFRLGLPGISVTGAGTLDPSSMALDSQVQVAVKDLSVPAGYAGVAALGSLEATAWVSGAAAAPDIRLKAGTKDLGINGIHLGNLALDAGLDAGKKLCINRFSLNRGGLSLAGKGDAVLFKEAFIPGAQIPVQFDLDLDAGPLDRLSDLVPDMAGMLGATVQVRGTVTSPEIQGQIHGDNLAAGPVYLGTGQAKFRLSQGMLSLDSLDLAAKDSRLTARGSARIMDSQGVLVTNPELDCSLTGSRIDLGALAHQASGILDITANIRGTLGNPRAALSCAGHGLSAQAVRIGDMRLAGNLENGLLTIQTATLENRTSALNLNGQVRVFNPGTLDLNPLPEFDLTVDQSRVRLEDFTDQAAGEVGFSGHISGNPQDMTGRLAVAAGKLGLWGQTLAGGQASLRVLGKTVHIDRADIRMPDGSRLSAHGMVRPVDQYLDLNLTTRNFNLADLAALRQQGLDKGSLTLDLRAWGRAKDLEAAGRLDLRDLAVLGEKQPNLGLDLGLNQRVLRLEGGVPGSGTPLVRGRYDLKTHDFSADLTLERLNLTPYFRLAGRPALGGRVSADVRARGKAGQWETLSGRADISDVDLTWENQPLAGISAVRILLDQGRLNLAPVRISLAREGELTLSGKGSLFGPKDADPGRDLDFRADGKIPLGVLVPLADGVTSARGMVRVSGRCTGSANQPDVSAEIRFKDLGLGLAWIEQEIRNLSGEIRITPDQIQVARVDGHLDQGEFSLKGRVGLGQGRVRDMDLGVRARNLGLDLPDMADMALNADLTLRGTAESSHLKGDIVLLHGRYYKDVALNLVSMATTRTRKVKPLKTDTLPPFLGNIALDIDLTRRDPLVVENNLADLELSPDLTIGGTGAAPLVQGRARVDAGVLKFRDTRFDVKKGVIDFTNPYRTEARIDVEGEMAVRSWVITLKVTGTPDDLDLTFESDPWEPHADILSLIAFGKTTRELRSADGGGAFAPQEILANMVAQSLQKEVKAATGLDYFEIETNDNAQAAADGNNPRVKVTMGADLSRQISVKYGIAVRKGRTVQRVTTSYKLLESLVLNAFQETDGHFGGEVRYRLEFR